jgi:hypothetical protein
MWTVANRKAWLSPPFHIVGGADVSAWLAPSHCLKRRRSQPPRRCSSLAVIHMLGHTHYFVSGRGAVSVGILYGIMSNVI